MESNRRSHYQSHSHHQTQSRISSPQMALQYRDSLQYRQSHYPSQQPIDRNYRHQAFGRTSYPSPGQSYGPLPAPQTLPSIRMITGDALDGHKEHESSPMPRQMPTPPGSSDISRMHYSFSKYEGEDGYDTDDSAHHREPLDFQPIAYPKFPHNPTMPSLEAMVRSYINKRDDRPFSQRHVSPPTVEAYETMGHFVQDMRLNESESPMMIPHGLKRPAPRDADYAPSAMAYSPQAGYLRRHDSGMTLDDSSSSADSTEDHHSPEYRSDYPASMQPSRKRRISVGSNDAHYNEGSPGMSQARRATAGHVRTASKGSNSKHSAPVAKNARAQKSKIQKSDRWEEYPDFSPPQTNAAKGMTEAKSVKDWHGNSINVREDPDRKHLSEAELEVAQRLHLPCAKYLCVKRQIFEELVKWLRDEQEKKTPNWNKTTAQGAVNCDVTKASELFMFYQRMGWFDKELFTKWTDKPKGSIHYSHQTIAAASAA